ncbi:MAG TPA: Dyp-type peroxidase [Acidimicrobiales bacterium]|nr:Dyp-type peroxidase [Acidimicrobiales bacterium]
MCEWEAPPEPDVVRRCSVPATPTTHSRRSFLKTVVFGAGVVGAPSTIIQPAGRSGARLTTGQPSGDFVPFYGKHQAGIETEPPAHLEFAAYDVTTTSVEDLVDLLRGWTHAAAAFGAGRSVADASGQPLSLPRNSLTLTFGFGPNVFDGRFGLSQRAPKGLQPLPPFATDQLDAAISGGDLAIQACSNDQSVASMAIEHLSRIAAGLAVVRWQQAGFRSSMAAGRVPTFRNLLGFKDGTANPASGTSAFDSTVWISSSSQPSWVRGGTFLCFRHIQTDVAKWNTLSVPDQQVAIGRTKESGAPLSGGSEFSPLNLQKLDANGVPAIPIDSHVRLASPEVNGGARLLRRGYNYDNGVNPMTGSREEGLLFLAYVKDIDKQFVPIQQRLAEHDRLNPFITPVGSAVFFVPPGCRRGGWIGESLFS